MSVRRSASLALAAALVLAGCQDEPEPRFEPTPSASSSPTDPETSEEPQAQTAEEFIEEWVDLAHRDAEHREKQTPFLSASSGCRAMRTTLPNRVERIYAAGGFVIRPMAGPSIASQSVGPAQQTRCYADRARVSPTEFRDDATSEVERLAWRTYECIVYAHRSSWRLERCS